MQKNRSRSGCHKLAVAACGVKSVFTSVAVSVSRRSRPKADDRRIPLPSRVATTCCKWGVNPSKRAISGLWRQAREIADAVFISSEQDGRFPNHSFSRARRFGRNRCEATAGLPNCRSLSYCSRPKASMAVHFPRRRVSIILILFRIKARKNRCSSARNSPEKIMYRLRRSLGKSSINNSLDKFAATTSIPGENFHCRASAI
jgi:hypothetical protein